MVTVIRVLGLAGRKVTLMERKLLPGPVRTPPLRHQDEYQEQLIESPTPSRVFLHGQDEVQPCLGRAYQRPSSVVPRAGVGVKADLFLPTPARQPSLGEPSDLHGLVGRGS